MELDLRAEFDTVPDLYFNTAYFGPSPTSAIKKTRLILDKEANPSFRPYDVWRTIPDQVREKFAQLLGVDADHISHHTSVGEVVSLISLGYPFEEGDSVVCFEGDYPSDVIPWMVNERRQGYELVRLPIDLLYRPEELEKEIPASARVINFSHVAFNTGKLVDLDALLDLCHKRDLFTVVDVSQSFGGMELKSEWVQKIDVITGCTYKWLLGPYGHGFACWSERALERVDRVMSSWMSSPNSYKEGDLLKYTTDSLPGARKYDRGQAPSMLSMGLLSSGLDLLSEIGLEKIEKHNRSLVNQFLEGVSKNHYEVMGGDSNIVCLKQKSPSSSHELKKILEGSGVDLSVREGNLRASFHLFNTSENVEKLIGVLNQV